MRVAPKSPERPLSVWTPRKTSLISSGVDCALLQQLVEHEEVAPEPVDELLGLAEELVARSTLARVRRLPSSRPQGPPPDFGDTPRLGSSSPAHVLRSCSGVNGFGT